MGSIHLKEEPLQTAYLLRLAPEDLEAAISGCAHHRGLCLRINPAVTTQASPDVTEVMREHLSLEGAQLKPPTVQSLLEAEGIVMAGSAHQLSVYRADVGRHT